jgi:hypothetical protein
MRVVLVVAVVLVVVSLQVAVEEVETAPRVP